MPKIKYAMSSRQCEIAAESYTACLLAQSGYDILVQYGANQPHYDLMAVKGEERKLPISVKGSQDGGWMLAVRYVKPGVNYRVAIDKWLSAQRNDVIYMFVGFLHVPLGEAPRVYVARPPEIATQLKLQCSGRGHGSLQEDTPTFSPRSKYKDKVPAEWCYSTKRIDSI
jgi:hypothetical protein